jgi:hypothetical protein
MYHLLNVNRNVKTSKNTEKGYLTGIMYLYPNEKLCPNAINAKCSAWLHGACLVNAGSAMMYKKINEGRQRKTNMFLNQKELFMNLLISDIEKLIRKAKKDNLIPNIRLNGTSDIAWEYIKHNDKTIFEIFPDIQFYDYTKLSYRLNHKIPNYDLTFSYSSANDYDKEVKRAIKFNSRMSVVFYPSIPNEFMGKKVIDGDSNDLRFLEEQNIIVGLKYKGKLSGINSEFVARV